MFCYTMYLIQYKNGSSQLCSTHFFGFCYQIGFVDENLAITWEFDHSWQIKKERDPFLPTKLLWGGNSKKNLQWSSSNSQFLHHSKNYTMVDWYNKNLWKIHARNPLEKVCFRDHSVTLAPDVSKIKWVLFVETKTYYQLKFYYVLFLFYFQIIK